MPPVPQAQAPRLAAFHSDAHPLPLPPGHRFPAAKYAALRQRLEAELGGALDLQPAPAARPEDLARAHAPGYVEAVLHGRLDAAAQREIGFPWSPGLLRRCLHSVGGTLAAVARARDEGVAGQLAGGTHHAAADRGSGFCVFNDLAVAVRLLQAEAQAAGQPPPRIAVVDLDVHQGNGTAAILGEDPTVYTLSLHGANNFPFRKVAGRDDVALPDGCGDGPYLAALDAALARLWAWCPRPELLLYLAGADPHEGDRLGRLRLSTAGLQARDARVFGAACARRVPLAFCMGGGYGEDLEAMLAVQLNTWREAWRARQAWAAAGEGSATIGP